MSKKERLTEILRSLPCLGEDDYTDDKATIDWLSEELQKAWEANEQLEKVREAAGKIGCTKMGGSCCMIGWNDLKKAWDEFETARKALGE